MRVKILAAMAGVVISTAVSLLSFAGQPPKRPAGKTAGTKRAVDFDKQIRPLFAAHCVKCHGPKKQEGGLRLDHRTPALHGGDSGRLLVAGNSAASEIVKRITAKDESERMPPPGKANKPLSKMQIALLRKWIDEGGQWPKGGGRLTVKTNHWAYQPVKDVSPPAFSDGAAKRWIRNGIDAFVLAQLRKRGIKPSPAADRYTLIKRLSYDLIGLPPDPKDVDTFVADRSPNAYEKLVDRLLNSKHFGERWGRHWLDMARYADSDGYEKDRPRPNAWRYRDWVIDAVNRDMPFDQFTREQLAGDLLPHATEMQKLATAFHRQTLTNTEGGTDKEQFRVEAIFDRVATTGTVWLGLTVGCAQCHSHKYDPITQAEYYQLFAFYNNGDETNTQVARSLEAVKRYSAAKAVHDKRVKALETQLAALRKKLAPGLPEWEAAMQAKLKSEAKNKLQFHPVKIRATSLQSPVKFTSQKDGSVLVTGPAPDKDTYSIDVFPKTAGALTGFRVEALPDKRLPNNGPGRTPHGNFVLTHLQVQRVTASGEKTDIVPVKVVKATHSFAQKTFPAKNALDPNDRTGWAISPQMGKANHAEFFLARPLQLQRNIFVRIVLQQNYGGKHTLGKFRITAMTGTQPGLAIPKDVRAALRTPKEKRDAKQQAVVLRYFARENTAYRKLDDRLVALKKGTPKPPVMTVRVVSQRTKNPRRTHILRRGDFLQPQAEVQPDTLAVLHALKPRKKTGRPDRLDLANWLMDPANPLTPRVTVNHIWWHLFGKAIVETMNDFGVRGEKPSHPQLLDWLAKEIIRRKWSRKAMIKLIVTSATYRQSSAHRRELAEIDPQNRLLARQNRFRVEAEIVRDIYLKASGLLSPKIGGPSVFPPMPPDVAALSYAGNFKWKTSTGEDRYRRGIYTFFKRTAPHPNLTTFDCPDSNTTNVKRRASNTPLMALTTLNNVVFVEASQAMAKRILTEKRLQTDEDRLKQAVRSCIARPPSEKEIAAFHNLLEDSRRWYAGHPKEAAKLVGGYQPKTVKPSEAAAWVATCRIIMNMDEFLTRE
ncbi:MAG: DUF1553 domain-containing protein [Planctomycetaceae bacterium]